MQRNDFGQFIRNFFDQYLVGQRGLSSHTVLAYRDSWKLFLNFLCQSLKKKSVDLCLQDISSQSIRKFLDYLEDTRKNAALTRNNRLAAIHSFFQYLSTVDPRHLPQCQSVLAVPFKRAARRNPNYLEREEVQAIFSEIKPAKPLGQRDDALLRFLYNTGARAHEVVNIDLSHVRFTRPYSVLIHGKGKKERTCPLWPETISTLKAYLEQRSVRLNENVPLFVNIDGKRLTRFGLRYIVTTRAASAAKKCPTLLSRRVTPHTWRHTTAMHLLQANVDLSMIRSWLGHASIETTHGYVEIDLEMKRKTLQASEKILPSRKKSQPLWQTKKDIITWLTSL